MIENISIADTATYPSSPVAIDGLGKFNFIYGSNGTGKTTITRVIANEALHPKCSVKWKAGKQLQAMVYNRDFVADNFSQSSELKGIFTLGKDSIETEKKIVVANAELDRISTRILNLSTTLSGDDQVSGKKGDLAAMEDGIAVKCWAVQTKHKAKLAEAMTGFRGSKESFMDKIIKERAPNSTELLSQEDLEKKAEIIYGPPPAVENLLRPIDMAILVGYERNLVLKKKVIGKHDVNISAMIEKLGNSDWVRQGRSFFDVNGMDCPFCQQKTTQVFADSLNEYFDESFLDDSQAIDDLIANYATEADRIKAQFASAIAEPGKFLDLEKLKMDSDLLNFKITINIQRLAAKKKEPSQVVELESVSNIAATVKSIIDVANVAITAHNNTVANLGQERRNLTAQVWKFLIETELKEQLTEYDRAKTPLANAIQGLTTKIDDAMTERQAKLGEIRLLEKEATSVQPSADEINGLLNSFGFRGFSLAKADGTNSYRLIRGDNTDARETLSEGERSFVTFLYFYQLLKGSVSSSGTTTERIVVFDDPVSSLDSDVLFIVGSLIKGLFHDIREDKGPIKQLFMLTHNVYFHKEVTFNSDKGLAAQYRYWAVRKPDSFSKIEKHDSNPIKTSYELLWTEVRRQDRCILTIQNTLRRILENYFKILGDIDPNKICETFEGKDKVMCRSLFSWVNDGSHYALDDLYVSIEPATVDTYLRVFRAIFVKQNQLAHYAMMMGPDYVEEPEPVANEKEAAAAPEAAAA
jgi:wobble nucleotide-excising tRNase